MILNVKCLNILYLSKTYDPINETNHNLRLASFRANTNNMNFLWNDNKTPFSALGSFLSRIIAWEFPLIFFLLHNGAT